jgi:hypothetical protein
LEITGSHVEQAAAAGSQRPTFPNGHNIVPVDHNRPEALSAPLCVPISLWLGVACAPEEGEFHGLEDPEDRRDRAWRRDQLLRLRRVERLIHL